MNLGRGPRPDLVKSVIGFFSLASSSRETKPAVLAGVGKKFSLRT